MRVLLPDGTRLFVDVDGAALVPDGPELRERPVVLAVHGGPGADHSTFKPALGALTAVAQVVYVDLRGQGRSDRSDPTRWNLATWAADLDALCDAVGIDRPIVLAESAGTYVALQLAVDFPERPAALVLLGAAGRSRPERSAAVFERLGGPDARDAALAFWADPSNANRGRFLRHCRPLYGRRSGTVGEAALRVVGRPEVFAHFVQERASFDLLPHLDRVRVPVLVVQGVDDPITTLEDGRDVVEHLPAGLGRLEELAECGHGLLEEDPAGVLAAVRSFVGELSDNPGRRH